MNEISGLRGADQVAALFGCDPSLLCALLSPGYMGFAGGDYWSSSQVNSMIFVGANYQYFDDGTQGDARKDNNSLRVRPVRAF